MITGKDKEKVRKLINEYKRREELISKIRFDMMLTLDVLKQSEDEKIKAVLWLISDDIGRLSAK